MTRHLLAGTFLVCLAIFCASSAFSITTSAMFTDFGVTYGYFFEISEETPDDIYAATLQNTSPTGQAQDPLIDQMAFNMAAVLGTDFTIESINPDWTFQTGSGGIQFDYVGDRDTPFDRLAPGEALSFDFDFAADFFSGIESPFDIWTQTESSLGTGIGGGEDLGQVAVSFQQLGPGGGGSDLLASTWPNGGGGGGQENPIPEPGTMLLLGTGLLACAMLYRRKQP